MNNFTDEQWEDCQDLFYMLDANRNHLIEIQELVYGFHELGLKYADEEISALLKECDKDRDGTLSLEEFANVYRKAIMATSMSEDEVRNMFKKLDANRSGTLSKDELKRLLMKGEVVFSDREIDTLLRDFDENMDGELSLEEFLQSALGFA